MCLYKCVYHVSSFVLNHNTNEDHAMDLVLTVFSQLTRYDTNCNLQSRARTHAVLVIGLCELLGNPTT
jgi:hypothetical protein